MQNDMKRVGKIIQSARTAKGMTQTALADAIGVSIRTIIAIENGQRNPTFETIYGIVSVLSIPADLIFRPGEQTHTPGQEQFFREFLDATEQEQAVTMATSRAIWQASRGK